MLALLVAKPRSLTAKPRKWRLAAAAFVLDHLLLSVAGCFPHRPWLGPVISALPPGGPDVALTFDDGPDPETTPRIAAMLEARGLRASFFVIGERAARHPQLIEDLHRAGHRIENHSATHPASFAFSFLPRLGREIGGCQQTVTELVGRPPAYFRAPAGMRNPLLEGALARLGLHLVSWSKRGYDAADADADRVLGRLTRNLRRGDILLLHDGNAARTAAGRPVCLEVLPRLLDHLGEAGLEAGPLPEPR